MTGRCRCLAVAAVVCLLAAGCGRSDRPAAGQAESGEALFLRLCSGCHPEGRNVKYPAKSLDRLTLAANGITTVDDIVAVLRRPGPGMPVFDPVRLPDRDAAAVAAYVLAAFK